MSPENSEFINKLLNGAPVGMVISTYRIYGDHYTRTKYKIDRNNAETFFACLAFYPSPFGNITCC